MPCLPESTKSFRRGDHQDTLPESNQNTTPLSNKPLVQSQLIGGIRSALSNKNVLFAIPVFLTGSLRFTILNILIQYGSNRFKLKISTGALFYTETAVVNMLLFLFAAPFLSFYIITKYHVRPQIIDLFVSRTCVSLLCFGSLLIGLSRTSKILPIGKCNILD